MYECRCDERLNTKVDGSVRLAYTGLLGGLEHLKIETRLISNITGLGVKADRCSSFFLFFSFLRGEQACWFGGALQIIKMSRQQSFNMMLAAAGGALTSAYVWFVL